jgi:light-regulated signal transduction histidine kinase (bacteriophytochrome)
LLNILGDFDDERARLADTQKAVLNVLADSDDERTRLADTQKAVLNVLADIEVEKVRVDHVNQNLSTEVAERRRAEHALHELSGELAQQVAELEAFTYTVAHDLRAPLRAMAGFTSTLIEESADQLNAEGRDALDEVRGAAVRMGQLLDDLLSFSRLSHHSLGTVIVDPLMVVRRVVRMLAREMDGREVDLDVRPMPQLTADASLCEQVYVNLLSNALKYTRKREAAQIEIGAVRQDGRTVYYVKDNGIGFDMRYTDKLFGIFQRLHTRDEYEGTGIGLATVRRIVERHGGRVWAESEPERGATFFFTFGGDQHHQERTHRRDPAGRGRPQRRQAHQARPAQSGSDQ